LIMKEIYARQGDDKLRTMGDISRALDLEI